MAIDVVTLGAARKYTAQTADALGAVKGAPCQLKSIEPIEGGQRITFEWTGDSGAKQTRTMDVMNGVNIVSGGIDSEGHLTFELSNGDIIDCGTIEGGGSTLKEPLTASVEIGTVTNGKTYPAGTDLEAIIRDILIKYLPPAVTLTTVPATKLYDIVTDSISTIELKAAVTKKTNSVTKVSLYRDGSMVLKEFTSGVSAGGNFTFTYTPDTPINTDVTFKATATDGKQQNSSTVTIKFVGKSYYGICAATVTNPDETVIKAGSNTLKDVRNFKYTGITTDWGKVLYSYPKSFGELTYIKDDVNNINYFDSFVKTETQVDGIDYYCYTLIDPTAAEDNEITFK